MKKPDSKKRIVDAFLQRNRQRIKDGERDLTTLMSLDPEVAEAAFKIFATPRAPLDWLTSPALSLRERQPLHVARTPTGAAQVVALLKGIANGNVC